VRCVPWTWPSWTTPWLTSRAEVLPGLPIWAVDANASFARPGPRLVDGIEALAGILHGVPVNPRVTGLAHKLT